MKLSRVNHSASEGTCQPSGQIPCAPSVLLPFISPDQSYMPPYAAQSQQRREMPTPAASRVVLRLLPIQHWEPIPTPEYVFPSISVTPSQAPLQVGVDPDQLPEDSQERVSDPASVNSASQEYDAVAK
jgi:hypothetical protein